MTRLNPRSKLPLYHQLHEILRAEILEGKYQPGDLIPAESELIGSYRVSRTTVRQALDLLVREGLVYRQRGRGSFVSHRGLEEGLVRMVSFTEDMKRRNFEPGTRVLCAELIPAPPQIAERLEVEAGEEVAHIRRLRLADGEPLAVEDTHLVHRLFPGILGRATLTASLQDAARDYGIRWSLAKQTIRAVEANSELARLLSVRAKSALLYVERISYSEAQVPAEFLRIHYRGDRYLLYADLQG